MGKEINREGGGEPLERKLSPEHRQTVWTTGASLPRGGALTAFLNPENFPTKASALPCCVRRIPREACRTPYRTWMGSGWTLASSWMWGCRSLEVSRCQTPSMVLCDAWDRVGVEGSMGCGQAGTQAEALPWHARPCTWQQQNGRTIAGQTKPHNPHSASSGGQCTARGAAARAQKEGAKSSRVAEVFIYRAVYLDTGFFRRGGGVGGQPCASTPPPRMALPLAVSCCWFPLPRPNAVGLDRVGPCRIGGHPPPQASK